MLDIRFIRENPELVKKAAEVKGYKVDVDQLLEVDKNARELLAKAEELRRERNQLAETVKKSKKPTSEQIEQGKKLKTDLADVEERLRLTAEEADLLHKAIPNLPTADVPLGKSEDDNVVAKEVGEKPKFDFAPKNHWEIAEARGWIDKERAAKVAGSRFAYLKGDLVKLQFAIIQFVIDAVTDEAVLQNIINQADLKDVSSKAFTPVLPPAIVRTDAYEATARLDSENVTYKLADDEQWLNASAEHSLAPMYKDEVLSEADLPIRYLGYSTSFRREAGTYGKDMEGILRMHQFDKLEMESFSTPQQGMGEHLLFIAIQEYLMQQLQIPYRVLMKCTADIGGPNARGVDIEAWLPGQDKYRETHTADYMTDYQARRMQTRVRRENGDLELVHTNDATAFALGRAMIAIIENYQTADGKVRVPSVLQPYFGGHSKATQILG